MLEKYFISELSALLQVTPCRPHSQLLCLACMVKKKRKKEMSDGIIHSQIEIKPLDLEHQFTLLEKQATLRQLNKVLSEN